MNLKRLINKSVCGTIGYISSQDDLDLLEQYILYNLPVLKEYKQIIVATNYKKYPEFSKENTIIWKKYFPNCILLDSKINRGHNFGTADLDNIIFEWCKENNIDWLFKTSNDFVFLEKMMDIEIEIEDADFYYLNGIGYKGLVDHNFDFNDIIHNNFYPQTNFYFINVLKVDYINNKQYLDETYQFIKTISNYNGKVWEYIKGWSCERFLLQCIERNNLSKYHLVSQEKYIKLLQTVKDYEIHDCSHKNIMINGICHFHFPQQNIIEI